jgi:hypothetical protein
MINRALPGVAPTRSRTDELTLDQLLAEPIVQQLMRRDNIDETTIRQLLQKTASAGLTSCAEDDLKADDPHSIVRLRHEAAWLWCSR